MAAYAALISLENTIYRLLNQDKFFTSRKEKQQIRSLLRNVNSFQGLLEEFPNKFNSLEGQISRLANEAEDILEYRLLEKVPSDYYYQDQPEIVIGEIDLLLAQALMHERETTSRNIQLGARSWTEQLKSKINNTKFYFFYKNLRLQWIRPGVQGGSSSSNASAPHIRQDAMVGFEDYVLHLKERLCAEQSELQVIPICGMGGIGKTTLAKNVYDDPSIMETFDIRVWIIISQDYTAQRIFSSLLHSLKDFDTGKLGKTDEEKVFKILKCRKYLIVIDDIWSSKPWDIVRMVFPDDSNGSRVMLTTRLSDVASYPDSSSKICEMHVLDADQSWTLFKHKVLGDEDCPSELENIGKEIARSCHGLPLAIVVTAGVVSTVSRNVASWQVIAVNVKSAEKNQIEEILALSYFQLPPYLRPCFLYMGSFPEDYDINATKLIRLWVTEGFLKSPPNYDSFETVAEECLEELVKRNLVLVTKRKYDGRIKSCGLHDLMRDLCIRKAEESKFFLNLTNRPHLAIERFMRRLRCQRRVSVSSSNLQKVASYHYKSSIHSIKCSEYFVVDLNFLRRVRLLRVLDAESCDVRYAPLIKPLELFHLRFLSIRYSHRLLAGLSNLQNLQTLIIRQEEETKFGVRVGVCSLLLPWCMTQLRHVYFHGIIYLDTPKETSSTLGSLQTVSYVSHTSCTGRILKRIPNIKKFKVDCSGTPHHGEAACLNDLVHLHQLESLEIYAGRWW